jgi:pimeloyl-ACP methyl ester carboxylesterase
MTPPVVPGAEECWSTVAGYKMRYLRAGTGPPVLLIHGLSAYSFSWRQVIPALSSIRTVFAPDLLGSGFSDQPRDLDYGMTASAQRVWQWLDRLAVGSIDLVGSSLGGGISVRMTALAPERVKKLVLAAPVNPWSRHGRLATRVLATRTGTKIFMGGVPLIQATGNFWLKRLFGDPRRIAPGTLEGYSAPLAKRSAWEYGMALMPHWRADLRQLAEDYARLADKRALLIWGDRDIAVDPSSAQEILKRMPRVDLKILKGVGHIPYDEVPDEFSRIVREFLCSL